MIVAAHGKPQLRAKFSGRHVAGDDVVDIAQPNQAGAIERLLVAGQNRVGEVPAVLIRPVQQLERTVQLQRRLGCVGGSLRWGFDSDSPAQLHLQSHRNEIEGWGAQLLERKTTEPLVG